MWSLIFLMQYCSECFLLLWKQRLLYSIQSSDELSEYLVEQLGTLEASCSTRLPLSTQTSTSAEAAETGGTITGSPIKARAEPSASPQEVYHTTGKSVIY